MRELTGIGKKKVSLDELQAYYNPADYAALAALVGRLTERGRLKPVKSSGLNGKKPALYLAYHVVAAAEPDYDDYRRELQYSLHSTLRIDYYLKHLARYAEDRPGVMALSQYLTHRAAGLKTRSSLNERSFEIWGREKFLQREQGLRLLKNLGLTLSDLNIYETTEPLAVYAHHKDTPQNIIILENKDTFYSMRRHLLAGATRIFGLEVGTLIYGAGKRVIKAFKDFALSTEPYLSAADNQLYYCGDLDYEGVIIYESLKTGYGQNLNLRLLLPAYRRMLHKAERYTLPLTSPGQNRRLGRQFLEEFAPDERRQILALLAEDRYIPQEILNPSDF